MDKAIIKQREDYINALAEAMRLAPSKEERLVILDLWDEAYEKFKNIKNISEYKQSLFQEKAG